MVVDKNSVRLTRPRSAAVAALSRRERELLALLGKGATLKEAAAQMQVSYKTADNQKTSLMRKLGIHDRVELARFAIREGLVSPA
jgi:DNA-binding NarL/FixJ family response regulator